jgi:outer membrane receptor for monomeric catechols
VLIADPDDPTLQQRPGQRQRIDGTELAVNGYLMPDWEIAANLTYIVPRITRSSVPAEVGKQLPGAARANANLWTTYEFNDDWQVGTGLNFLGHRYADTLNTANIPSYVVWNAMVAWQAADALRLQVNGKNLTDEPYFDGAYYSDPTENHVVPGAGRTITVTLKYDF